MKRHWVCLQLRFEAPKDVKLEMLSRRAPLSGNTSLYLSSLFYLEFALPRVCNIHSRPVKVNEQQACMAGYCRFINSHVVAMKLSVNVTPAC